MIESDRYLPSKNSKIAQNWAWSLFLVLIFPLAVGNTVFLHSAKAQNTAPQGIATEANILYVDPKGGNDRQGDGSEQSPFKTITQALKIAQPNTVISLNPGTYSEQTGESFPLIMGKSVTIQGTPSAQGYNVIINGSGYFVSRTGAGQQVTIAAIKQAQGLTGVTVINPHNRGHGLWIESASPTVTSNSFIRNGNTGVSVNGNGAPTITDNYFSRNGGNGLLIYDTSKPTVENNEFENTGFGISIVQNAAPILRGNSFSSNRIGIILEGNSQAVLRDNQITNSLEYGLVSIAQSKVDLGTVAQPGNNIFRGNKKLDIQNATNNSIIAVGTEINGDTEGSIDFRGTDNSEITANKPAELPPLRLKPLSPLPDTSTISRANPQALRGIQAPAFDPGVSPSPTPELPNSNNNILPPPRIITAPPSPPSPPSTTNKTNELVFTAPSSQSVQTNPVPAVEFHSSQGTAYIDEPSLSTPSLPQPNPSIQPSTLGESPQNSEISSLSDVLGEVSTANASNRTNEYRVIVEATNDSQKEQVRSLYPDAFPTIYQGKSMLQVGVFSSKNTADIVLQSLEKIGIKGVILN